MEGRLPGQAGSTVPARTGRDPGRSDYKSHRGWAAVGRRSGGSVGVVRMSGWPELRGAEVWGLLELGGVGGSVGGGGCSEAYK